MFAEFYKDLPGESPNEGTAGLGITGTVIPLPLNESRIHRDFVVLDTAGKGGFGDVLKVRNVIDE